MASYLLRHPLLTFVPLLLAFSGVGLLRLYSRRCSPSLLGWCFSFRPAVVLVFLVSPMLILLVSAQAGVHRSVSAWSLSSLPPPSLPISSSTGRVHPFYAAPVLIVWCCGGPLLLKHGAWVGLLFLHWASCFLFVLSPILYVKTPYFHYSAARWSPSRSLFLLPLHCGCC